MLKPAEVLKALKRFSKNNPALFLTNYSFTYYFQKDETMSRNILFADDVFAKPKTMLSEYLELEGCTMRTNQVALIDGKLTDVTIISADNTPIKISALAVLTNCKIHCTDLLIEGQFSGEINAMGNIELGESAHVEGTAKVSGSLVISPLAEAVELKISHSSAKKAALVQETKPAPTSVYQLKSDQAMTLARAG